MQIYKQIFTLPTKVRCFFSFPQVYTYLKGEVRPLRGRLDRVPSDGLRPSVTMQCDDSVVNYQPEYKPGYQHQ